MVYPIYYLFSTGLAPSRGTYNATLMPRILYAIVHNISVRTKKGKMRKKKEIFQNVLHRDNHKRESV